MKIYTVWFMLLVAIVACHHDDQVMGDITECGNFHVRFQINMTRLTDVAVILQRKDALEAVDASAPNRLLFNAIAFYSLGKYLNDDLAMEIGIQFLNDALALVNEESGYFIEGRGWDSSYNGVAIKLGMELYTLLSDDHPVTTALRQRLTCATLWQAARVLDSGEISTKGSSRVFPGAKCFWKMRKQ